MKDIMQRPGWEIVRAMRLAHVTQLEVARSVGVDPSVVNAVIHRKFDRSRGITPHVVRGVRERIRMMLSLPARLEAQRALSIPVAAPPRRRRVKA